MTSAYEAELEDELEDELEGEWEGEFESEGELELEGEEEFEFEDEMEGEFESFSPARKIYPDAMMEHMGHMAAEAESEEEAAEYFLPLVGLAAKKLLPVVAKAVSPALKRAIPRVAKAVTRVEPQLTRGVGVIARKLYRQPGTRRLLRAIPAIARRTVYSVAKTAAKGRPITARGAIRTLARQARRVLHHPHHRRHALRRSRVMDHRLHRHLGPQAVRPHGGVPTAAAGSYPVRTATGAIAYRPAARGGAVSGPVCRCGAAPASPAPQYCRCCGQVLR
jgi:hypothetical protein